MLDSDDPGPADPSLLDGILDAAGLSGGGKRIRCPLCGWQPARSDRWVCGCGEEWNTFETRGRCPSCRHQWTWTECLRCRRRSAHERWYG
jgi:hypothetical protein